MSYTLRAHDWADVGNYPTLGAAQRAAEHHVIREMAKHTALPMSWMDLTWEARGDGTWHGVPTVILRTADRYPEFRGQPVEPLYTIRATDPRAGGEGR